MKPSAAIHHSLNPENPQGRPVPGMGAWRRGLSLCFDAGAWLAAVCVLLILVLMIFQSVSRQAGVPVSGFNELVAWLCAGSAFLVMAHAFKHGDFVRVGLMLEKLSAGARHGVELLALAVGAVATGYLAWWAAHYTWQSWVLQDMSIGKYIVPMWIPQLSFAVGSCLLFLAVLDELWLVMKGNRPTFVVAVEQRHAAGDFSAEL